MRTRAVGANERRAGALVAGVYGEPIWFYRDRETTIGGAWCLRAAGAFQLLHGCWLEFDSRLAEHDGMVLIGGDGWRDPFSVGC